MTTIIYDHKAKQIACDSRSTADNIVMTDECVKYQYAEDGSLWFICGCSSDHDLLIEAFKGGDKQKSEHDLDSYAIRVKNGEVHVCGVQDNMTWTNRLDYSRAIGSGYQFAISALDVGMTAKQAVEFAIKRDYMSGGKVHVYDVEKGEFLNSK